MMSFFKGPAKNDTVFVDITINHFVKKDKGKNENSWGFSLNNATC